MGRSTNAEICYGVRVEDPFVLPWVRKEMEEPEDWWMEVRGFAPTWNPYNPAGYHKPGVTENDPRIQTYFQERVAWKRANPIPFEIVNACSCDHPEYILAVKNCVWTATRGNPIFIDPADLEPDTKGVQALLDFCQEFNIPVGADEPHWWLSSYTD